MAQSNDCQYAPHQRVVMMLYAATSWLWFALALIRHRGWRGFATVEVDARVMAPGEWMEHLWTRGVDAWIFWPGPDCHWTFFVRKTQARWAREIVRRASHGHSPRPWNPNRPLPWLDRIGGWF